LRRLARQGIEKVPDGTFFVRYSSEEARSAHRGMVIYVCRLVKFLLILYEPLENDPTI
jgi:hypothetical protein